MNLPKAIELVDYSWQLMTFLNPLDALIPKIPFSFFFNFWVCVTCKAWGSDSVGFLGSCQPSPFWGRGGSGRRALSPPPPPPVPKTRPPLCPCYPSNKCGTTIFVRGIRGKFMQHHRWLVPSTFQWQSLSWSRNCAHYDYLLSNSSALLVAFQLPLTQVSAQVPVPAQVPVQPGLQVSSTLLVQVRIQRPKCSFVRSVSNNGKRHTNWRSLSIQG